MRNRYKVSQSSGLDTLRRNLRAPAFEAQPRGDKRRQTSYRQGQCEQEHLAPLHLARTRSLSFPARTHKTHTKTKQIRSPGSGLPTGFPESKAFTFTGFRCSQDKSQRHLFLWVGPIVSPGALHTGFDRMTSIQRRHLLVLHPGMLYTSLQDHAQRKDEAHLQSVATIHHQIIIRRYQPHLMQILTVSPRVSTASQGCLQGSSVHTVF